MSKCIKCGRELKSAEIPEFYNGMCEKCYKEKNYAEYPFKQGINDYQNQIDQLKQQLAEKACRIEELEGQFAYECECNKQLVELQKQLAEKDKEIKKLNWQLKDKDFIIKNLNHSLSVAPNANAGQRARIDELTKIVKEKDKEIERLKNLFKLNNEVVINQGKEIFDLRVQVLQQKQNQTQLAIQELEKVKDWLNEPFDEDGCFKIGGDLIDFIDQQIKELKGV